MIPVRLLNGSTVYVNTELLESVTAAADTIITLTSGRKIVASSSPEEIIDAVVAYRRRVLERPQMGGGGQSRTEAVRPEGSRERRPFAQAAASGQPQTGPLPLDPRAPTLDPHAAPSP